MLSSNSKYIIKQNKPCADYGKITIEGTFELNRKSDLYKNLENLFGEFTNIGNGKILIIRNEQFDLYIYDENRFVMNKLETIEKARGILDKIFS